MDSTFAFLVAEKLNFEIKGCPTPNTCFTNFGPKRVKELITTGSPLEYHKQGGLRTSRPSTGQPVTGEGEKFI